jgi:purine-binding chemotaxis protein CheW
VAEKSLDVVVFDLGGRLFGLPATEVRELLRATAVVPLPGAPPIIMGILNLRGAVVPVLDIRTRFGLPGKELEPADHFIVTQAGGRLVALHVDRAVDLVRLNAADVEDAAAVLPNVEFVTRVAKLAGNLVLLPDLARALAHVETALPAFAPFPPVKGE